jgi:protein involved in polysaccharide export with SLBB domain
MTRRILNRTLLAALIVTALALPRTTSAQDPAVPDPGRTQVTRAALAELLTRYEETANATSYSSAFRANASAQAALIRRRLEEGDFQTGDQIALAVAGETPLTATFTVQGGPSILLPEIGSISLRGVLRSELRDHLAEQLGRYIRNPQVQANSLLRIMVTGAVARAGYYTVPAEALVSEAIMGAGGLGAGADPNSVKIVRRSSVIWEGEPLQQAIAEGRTVDQLSLAAGDELVIGTRRAETNGFRSILVAIPSAVMVLAGVRALF